MCSKNHKEKLYKIKEVSNLAGVTVRTLHHYDAIALLKPCFINDAGYRYYGDKELEKLQQILFFRELDFSLEEIKKILNNPDFDKVSCLTLHRQLLLEKRQRLDNIIASLDKTLLSLEGGIKMNKKEMFKSFDMKSIEEHKAKYTEETKKKYGDTPAYKESQEKTSKYGKSDWENIMGEAEKIYISLSDLMNEEPNSPKVQALVQQWRDHITNNFYNCTLDIFRGLALMYTTDERFKENIDKYGEGLTEFLSSAMIIYCDNLEK